LAASEIENEDIFGVISKLTSRPRVENGEDLAEEVLATCNCQRL
jgi:hypothetical protein